MKKEKNRNESVERKTKKKQVSFYAKKKIRRRVIFIVTCLCLYFCTKRPI